MQYLWMALMSLGILGADQLSKFWVMHDIAASPCADAQACLLHTQTMQSIQGISSEALAALPYRVGAVDGVFCLVHVHNTGAAFSFLQGQHWLFYLVTAALAAFIIWEFPKKKMPFTMFDRWMIVAIFAGGIGNVIDRIVLGYVVDMIHVDFMNFAVFNVADCFITCGCIALIVHLAFFNKEFWKDDKKKK